MTKQQKIREWAIKSLMAYKGYDRVPTEYIIDHVFADLHSQGVVILDKERGLPDFCKGERKRLEDIPKHWDMRDKHDTWEMQDCEHTIGVTLRTQGDMLKAGYVAVEPLIEEGK